MLLVLNKNYNSIDCQEISMWKTVLVNNDFKSKQLTGWQISQLSKTLLYSLVY